MTTGTAIVARNDLALAGPLGSLDAYLDRVSRIPVLSREKERELAERFRDEHDLEAARTDDALREVVASLSDSPNETGLRHRMTSLIAEMGLDIYHLAAIDPAQSYEVGMLSAPIFNVHGHAAFTLSLLGFKESLKADAIQELAERLMTSCLMVTRKSNGRMPSLDTKHSKGGRG